MGAFFQSAKLPSVLKKEKFGSLLDKANTRGSPQLRRESEAEVSVIQVSSPLP